MIMPAIALPIVFIAAKPIMVPPARAIKPAIMPASTPNCARTTIKINRTEPHLKIRINVKATSSLSFPSSFNLDTRLRRKLYTKKTTMQAIVKNKILLKL